MFYFSAEDLNCMATKWWTASCLFREKQQNENSTIIRLLIANKIQIEIKIAKNTWVARTLWWDSGHTNICENLRWNRHELQHIHSCHIIGHITGSASQCSHTHVSILHPAQTKKCLFFFCIEKITARILNASAPALTHTHTKETIIIQTNAGVAQWHIREFDVHAAHISPIFMAMCWQTPSPYEIKCGERNEEKIARALALRNAHSLAATRNSLH